MATARLHAKAATKKARLTPRGIKSLKGARASKKGMSLCFARIRKIATKAALGSRFSLDETQVLGALGQESKAKGTNGFNGKKIDQVTRKTRKRKLTRR